MVPYNHSHIYTHRDWLLIGRLKSEMITDQLIHSGAMANLLNSKF